MIFYIYKLCYAKVKYFDQNWDDFAPCTDNWQRLALTGRQVSPGLFEVMAQLGKRKCLERLDKAIKCLRKIILEMTSIILGYNN